MPDTPHLISTHPAHARVAVRRQRYLPDTCGPPEAAVHDHGVLSLLLEGRASLWMGTTYALEPGDLILIPEGMPHYMRDAEVGALLGASLCMGCLQRGPGGEELARAFASVRAGQAAVWRLDGAALTRARCCLEALEAELAGSLPERDAAVSAHLTLLGVELLRAKPLQLPTVEQPLVAQALAWIEAHAHEGASLRDVAQAVHRAPAHLAAVVKAETGRTVGDWITHARMSQARQLLLRSDETIEAIAARVGFASPSHFHRTFRRAHDLSPNAWRRVHRDAG